MKDVNSMKVQYYRIEFEFDIYIIVEQKKLKFQFHVMRFMTKNVFLNVYQMKK